MRAPLGAREAASAKRTVEEGASLHGEKGFEGDRRALLFSLSAIWISDTKP